MRFSAPITFPKCWSMLEWSLFLNGGRIRQCDLPIGPLVLWTRLVNYLKRTYKVVQIWPWLIFCKHNCQTLTCTSQCGLFTHKSVPVIFEPPCIIKELTCSKRTRTHARRAFGVYTQAYHVLPAGPRWENNQEFRRKEAHRPSFPRRGQSLRYSLDWWPLLKASFPNLSVLNCPYDLIEPQRSYVRSVFPDDHVISSRHAGWGATG